MNRGRLFLAVAAALAAIGCAGIGVQHLIQEKEAGKEYEELREEVAAAEEPEPVQEEPEEPEPDPVPEEEPIEIPVGFAALQEQNPDVYAWIRIPGTNVDYPILQHPEDNSYYLTHTIDHEKKTEGAIYTEDYNSKDFDDPNTVIYGHNMKNGSMFRTLHNYEDRSFFDENREVYIYLPDAVLEYRIFAAYIYDNRHLLLNFDFNDKDIYQKYLDDIFAIRNMNSFIDTTMEVDADDRIITLSTCNAGISTQRYLVQAVLISINH